MAPQQGSRAAATDSAGAAEQGSAAGQHFKRSPTLLFDILAESDKDKQQRKLQAAALSSPLPSPAAASGGQTQTQTQQQAHQGQQPQGLGSDPQPPGKRVSGGPATPDLPSPPHAGGGSAGPSSGTQGRVVQSPYQQQRQDAAPADVEGGDRAGAPAGGREQQQWQGADGAGSEAGSGVAAAAPGTRAGGRGGAAEEAERAEGGAADGGGAGPGGAAAAVVAAPGAAAAAAAAGTSVAPAAAPAPPPRDLLAEFTPRVILQELLGELFIPPERLTKQGSFGQGAFATVQSCGLEVAPGGPSLLVAVKSLKPHVLNDLEDLRRFLLEANLVRKLNHPNIVSIHGLGAHELTSLEALRHSAYVVMEGMQGGDLRMMVLRQMTSHSPAYSRLDALRWVTHIAAACAYLHETCRPMVIHRDLKPENVLLTGGPVDGRVAKITDFGLHKRARYNRTEDVLLAVTHEWSTRGGVGFYGPGGYHCGRSIHGGGGGGGGTVRGGGGGGGGGSVRAGAGTDRSYYGGSVIDASYYGGNAFADASAHWNATNRTVGAAAGGKGSNGGGSAHAPAGGGGGFGSNHSATASARYVALAAAGLAAASAEPTATTAIGFLSTTTTANGFVAGVAAANWSGGGNGDGNGSANGDAAGPHPHPHRVTPNRLVCAPLGLAAATAAAGGGADGFTEVVGLGPAVAAASALYGSNPGPGAGTATPGESLRAGSDAAAELGLADLASSAGPLPPYGNGNGKGVTDRERPYLLAYDKRYDTPPAGSKVSSSADLTGLHDASLAAAAASLTAAATAAAAAAAPVSADGPSTSHHRQQPPPTANQGQGQPALSAAQLAAAGWAPPNVVPTPPGAAGLEESVHRKMLALMALESAAAAAAGGGGGGFGAPVTAAAAAAAPGGAAAATGAADAPFSVTEFVRAAAVVTSATATGTGTAAAGAAAAGPEGGGPSALLLMRSMTLALQQQKDQQQQQQLPPAPPPPLAPHQPAVLAGGAIGSSTVAAAAAARAAARTAATMKTVPEDNRMSMDVGRPAAAAAAAAAAAGAGSSSTSSLSGSVTSGGRSRASAPPATSAGRRHAEAAHRREAEVAAAARMADATRQVGSLIYMAPELVTSGNYNEKVDVFSFAIIAYELFGGKLLAMKIANEYAMEVEAQRGAGAARGGPGGLPTAPGTRSAEEESEAGVMSYVMRRCGGAREPLPSWWPGPLRTLIARCWAQDPAARPSFSQIHRELRRMATEGTLADMDARDPLRGGGGCGCTVS